MSTTDTPYTDARTVLGRNTTADEELIPACFSRDIERDLARAREEVATYDRRRVEAIEATQRAVTRAENAEAEVARLNGLVNFMHEHGGRQVDGLYQQIKESHAQLTQSLATGERLREVLEEIGRYQGKGSPTTPWQEIVRDLGQTAREALAASPHAAPAAVHEDTKRLDWLERHNALLDAHDSGDGAPADWQVVYLTGNRNDLDAHSFKGTTARQAIDAAMAAAPLPPTKAGES